MESESEKWRMDEVLQSSDQALARFYFLLSEDDRAQLQRAHINPNGDLRCDVKFRED